MRALAGAAVGFVLLAGSAHGQAQTPTAPQPDPVLQAFVGSTSVLLRAYNEQAQELAAAQKTIADLKKQVEGWKTYARPLYTSPRTGAAAP